MSYRTKRGTQDTTDETGKRTILDGFYDRDDVIHQFCFAGQTAENVRQAVKLCAQYYTPPYEGYAHLLYETPDGKFWELSYSHCSCRGLDSAGDPEVVTREYIANNRHEAYGTDLSAAVAALWGDQ